MNGLYIGFPIEDYSIAKSFAAYLEAETGVQPVLGTMSAASQSQDAAALTACDLALFFLSSNSSSSKEEISQIRLADGLSKRHSFIVIDGICLTGEIAALSCRSDQIHLSDSRQLSKLISNVRQLLLEQDYSLEADCLNDYPFVDLGLSVLWATSNLGTSLPDMGGDYFAWGETAPKDEYSWFTYAFEPKDRNMYDVLEEEEDLTAIGFARYDCFDSKLYLDAVDDAATFMRGNPWRIPSEDDFRELLDNCDCEWVDHRSNPDADDYQHPVIGLRMTSRINGRILFLPAAGYKRYDADSGHGCLEESGSMGAYQCANRNEDNPIESRYLYFDGSRRSIRSASRELGFSIRPVFPKSVLK